MDRLMVVIRNDALVGVYTSGVDAWETARVLPGATVWHCAANSSNALLIVPRTVEQPIVDALREPVDQMSM